MMLSTVVQATSLLVHLIERSSVTSGWFSFFPIFPPLATPIDSDGYNLKTRLHHNDNI